ncbi:TIGR01244 family phosphatase [Rhodophyticola sp. CCM32]|uniref:TIGR01244 family sulfur transferase n=1 Tax=Rhodophyticola sp. CCM32 TaxID=2916397 RepID=UPI00107FC9EA|nr:TIGR01244 family sulfur transferase [Rhodophyticola sp. CCM32]QBY00053.1 TIGR01244 family phosphatase [Rhodophyticola sp. CCM32]
MDIRPLTETYAVAPQLEPADMATLAAEGVTTVICNRPDAENPPPLFAAEMQAAAEAAGLGFVFNPITGGAMTMDNVEEQADAMAGADGPVVAYCASGNRSSIVWAMTQAGTLPTDEILAATRAAGYMLDGLRPQIEALAARTG